MARALDVLYFVYFSTHIPITVFIDSQSVFPQWIFPKQLQNLLAWYGDTFKDPIMTGAPPPWFQPFLICLMILQLPFFFFATYAFWKGVRNCRWIRIPLIIYASHAATGIAGICYYLLVHDFSGYPGPQTFEERRNLQFVYLPYCVIPVIQLLDALFSDVYREKAKIN